MRRTVVMFMLAGLVGALVAVPIAVYASHQFTDVPNTNPFHDDIDWLADNGVTEGCSPTEYCPKDNVTREQMAAFMRRLAENQVVDAGSLQGVEADGLVKANRVLQASVSEDAFVTTGDVTSASTDGSSGVYVLEFTGYDLSECTAVVTNGWNQGTESGSSWDAAKVLMAEPSFDEVAVGFVDPTTNTPGATAFHIIIICPEFTPVTQ